MGTNRQPLSPQGYNIGTDPTNTNPFWGDLPIGGHGIPPGGLTGQVLGKKSDTDYDVIWVDQTGGTGGDYLPLSGGTLTGELSIDYPNATIVFKDGTAIRGSAYVDGQDMCIQAPEGNVRLLGAKVILTAADNQDTSIVMGKASIGKEGDNVEINVGTDDAYVEINRNGVKGGTGEIHVTEIHAPQELRLNPNSSTNAMGKRITNIGAPVNDNDAVRKIDLEHATPTLPVASATQLGGIKVGENLTIGADGTLNADTAVPAFTGFISQSNKRSTVVEPNSEGFLLTSYDNIEGYMILGFLMIEIKKAGEPPINYSCPFPRDNKPIVLDFSATAGELELTISNSYSSTTGGIRSVLVNNTSSEYTLSTYIIVHFYRIAPATLSVWEPSIHDSTETEVI